jgi:hypothetical protein
MPLPGDLTLLYVRCMQMNTAEAERIVRAGAEALQRGDPKTARAAFEKVTATGRANAQIWLLLAHACRSGGDQKGEEAALDQLLAVEPRNLRGLIMKGDCRAQSGDSRAATSFYKAAMGSAAGPLPPDLAAEKARIETWLKKVDADYRLHLERSLANAGVEGAQSSQRFQQSLEILFGEKQIFLQQPSAYYFPELPQRQFYEREEFPWLAAVEAYTDVMRTELQVVLEQEDEAFSPYLVASPARPRTDFHGLLDNPDWSTFYFWENGAAVEENVALCPRTYAALRDVPLPHITTRAPAIFFSRLRPGARIPPHNGTLNTRLICHLPLIVPPGCGFRVGNETREWETGKALIFDDTIEHEAWNDSNEDRVVLIFDIWRPELTDAERRAVTAIFEAVDSYSGPPADPPA